MVSGAVAEVLALALLAGVLLFAMLQPRGLPEATIAVPAAAIAVTLGIVSPDQAMHQIQTLGPTVGFLAAILVLAHLADDAGMFRWLGGVLGRSSAGQPIRLLTLVFAAAATTTAVLSLDATVVLLTPVVLRTAVDLGLPTKPHVYACTHLANSASTLLPVSNLTNLLAFSATGLSFIQFAAIMGLPWLVVIVLEYAAFRWFFRDDLRAPLTAPGAVATRPEPPEPNPAPPVFVLAVLSVTLAGFGASGFIGVEPVWIAVAGAVVLAVRSLFRREVTVPGLVREASPLFCLFVFALGIVVAAVTDRGMGRVLGGLLPTEPSFTGLLGVAVIAAVLANIVNNLPATLVMLGVLGLSPHPGLVLAMLIGVNVGPNLTYVGSLATLLWRRVLAQRAVTPRLSEFLRLGVLTVPAGVLAGVAALWLGLELAGMSR